MVVVVVVGLPCKMVRFPGDMPDCYNTTKKIMCHCSLCLGSLRTLLAQPEVIRPKDTRDLGHLRSRGGGGGWGSCPC